MAIVGYEYRIDGGLPVDIGLPDPLEWTVAGLDSVTSYEFEIRGYDAEGNRTAWSNTATATTGGSLFSDDFNDNSIDEDKWPTDFEGGGTTIDEATSRLEITPTANTVGTAGLTSRPLLFTDKEVEIDFTQIIGGDTGSGFNNQTFLIYKDANNYISLDKSGGGGFKYVYITVVTGGVSDSVEIYNNQWGNAKWKLEIAGTTLTTYEWNGSGFTQMRQQTVSWDLSSVVFKLQAGYWGTGNASTQKGIFDSLVSTALY